MPHHMFIVKADKRIDIEADHYFDFEDVKYCMYCGNRLRLERTPDTPQPEPSKPDLSSLSAKDRALAELKERMDKGESFEIISNKK
jgi:hypothetical protein